jgi:hypothetical protein
MKTRTIPEDVKEEVEEIVQRFNDQITPRGTCFYVPRFKGMYLYLDRSDCGDAGQVCRLRYTGKLDDWEFAIFKYSNNQYDPNEWLFPGGEHVDGTIEGAMKACLEAYPV